VILPTRHLTPGQSLLGACAVVLREIDRPVTVNRLWERLRENPEIGPYERFVLALDLLFIVGALDVDRGLLGRSQ
jgi:hypothetical protein